MSEDSGSAVEGSFERMLGKSGPVSAASGAGAADPVAGLIQQVEAGQLSLEQAVDQLVDRSVSGMTAHLDAAQRSELSELLRGALAMDPTLLGLRNERG